MLLLRRPMSSAPIWKNRNTSHKEAGMRPGLLPDLPAKFVRHWCVRCGQEYPEGFHTFCSCGGMVEVSYDLTRSRIYESSDPLHRFFDLMPIQDPRNLIALPMQY